ncbi:MAG: PorP/SprF family type IX secretion system membrane protein [Paludibacteraceae bacterium]|nr:PorP/SprF family type IX secretion system membrane protein [Paludibacteraceae bacterium]
MKKNLFLVAFLLLGTTLFAQSDFTLSEQMFSRINQNPSAIGNNENVQLFTSTRLQWASQGLAVTPTSALLNGHYYIEKAKSGVGLSFVYDELGLANQTINAKLCYAYNLDLREDMLLSLGLSLGVINKRFDPARHTWKDPSDPLIPQEVIQTTNFDLDFGFEWSWKYLLVGFSMTHMPNISKEVSTVVAPAHIYAYVRGNVPLPKQFSLVPAFAFTNVGALNKPAEGYKLENDNILNFSLTAMYQGKYWFGIGYRGGYTGLKDYPFSSDMLSFMIGAEWHWLRIGYCYDMSVGKNLRQYSSNTHEIILSFNIPTKYPAKW